MPQNAIPIAPGVRAGKAAPQVQDAQGNTLIGKASATSLNITAATVVKAAPGRAVKLTVVVAGSAAGSINDCLTTGAAAAANQVGVAPSTAGNYDIDMPCFTGIVVVPGTGQTLALSWT